MVLNVYVFRDIYLGPYLVDVVKFEVFEKKQQDGRDRLYDDFFVSIHIDTKLHALQHCGPAESCEGNQQTFEAF